MIHLNDLSFRDYSPDLHRPRGGRNNKPRHRGRAGAFILVGAALIAAEPPYAQPVGGWRLMRTANPQGGTDAVSMIRTADLLRSDPDLAGLMLRCAELGAEVVIVVVAPFPPGAHPSVTISADDKQWRYEASVVPPGAELLLPGDATGLAMGPWQSARELAVKVSSQEQSLGGIIPIDGIAGALTTLTANCPAGPAGPAKIGK